MHSLSSAFVSFSLVAPQSSRSPRRRDTHSQQQQQQSRTGLDSALAHSQHKQASDRAGAPRQRAGSPRRMRASLFLLVALAAAQREHHRRRSPPPPPPGPPGSGSCVNTCSFADDGDVRRDSGRTPALSMAGRRARIFRRIVLTFCLPLDSRRVSPLTVR